MLPLMPFPDHSDDASLWIYAAPRVLASDEQRAILGDLTEFFRSWQSHGRAVEGAAQIREDRFLLLAGELVLPHTGPISGCGMDAGRHAVEAAGARRDFAWGGGLSVYYRDAEGTVLRARRGAFRKYIRQGEIGGATPVFDLALTSVGALRHTGFEKPLADSWHAEAFGLAARPA